MKVLLGLIATVYFAFFVIPAFRDLLARRKTAKDFALLDDGLNDQFPVEVTLVVDLKKKIGTDRGVVWFADGLVGFSGAAFSFVLAARDIAPHWNKRHRVLSTSVIPQNAVVLLDAPGAVYLRIAPLIGHSRAYRERFDVFMDTHDEPTGERFWPPLEPFVEAESGQRALGR